MHVDTTNWTGEGTFTPILMEALKAIPAIAELRLEDAPSSRAESGYAFIANEIFVTFMVEDRREPTRWLGVVPATRRVTVPSMTIEALGAALAAVEGVGAPDYADAGMLQYLRTERIVAPYQTKGVKVVEMVRIYAAGSAPRP